MLSFIIHGVERPGEVKMANVDPGVKIWWTSGQALGLTRVIRDRAIFMAIRDR